MARRCDAGAWIGPRDGGLDALCEACQAPHALAPAAADGAPCPDCGAPLTAGELRSEELFGALQNLAAVLAAWDGVPAPLDAILPDRPRFLTDLDPPEPDPEQRPAGAGAHDPRGHPGAAAEPPGLRAALESLATGAFARARAQLEALAREVGSEPGPDRTRVWRALGIAAERLGDLAGAEAAYDRALERGARAQVGPDEPLVRLARGVLRARRGDFDGARTDLARAGDTREARWDRAALMVLEAVAATPGLPDAAAIERARQAAGPQSSWWSDFTVGRLLWILLVERARRDLPGGPDERVLRAAEAHFEFDTFWDRALRLAGYATLGLRAAAAATGAAIAVDLLAGLEREPFLGCPAAAPLAEAIARAARAVQEAEPGAALAAVRALMEREDLRRYRVPCARCGSGTLGVDRVEDDETAEPGREPVRAGNPTPT
ncbi:MAG: hypothetical protein HZC42_08010 [Candidatus Eisenbacteria bacterium]|nr:hypothetical protein [Candidatus Eisenbacteria bacterium]